MTMQTPTIYPSHPGGAPMTPIRTWGVGRGRPARRSFGMRELERRLNALRQRHAQFERLLRRETRGPFQDGLAIQRIKRLKLQIKDEMAVLAGLLRVERLSDVPPSGTT